MKTLVNTLVALAVSAICYSSVSGAVKNNEKQKFVIVKLTRFTARLEGPLKDGVLEEAWLPPKGKTVTAVVRLTRNEGTEFVEMIKIQQQGTSLELRLQLFDTGLKSLAEPLVFKAIEQGDQTMTFAGISQGAHRTLSYACPLPDRF